MDSAGPADQTVKVKASEKLEKYLNLERKKLWNIKVTVIPILVRDFGTFPKSLKKKTEVSGRIETILATVL